jgi:hypothetical protein
MNQKEVDNYACRIRDRTEQKGLSIHREPRLVYFTPTTDWIDKSDSSQFRSDFGQGWRATKKVRSGCKRVMRVLEYERCFSIRIDLNIRKFLQYAGATMIFKISIQSICMGQNAYMLVNM